MNLICIIPSLCQGAPLKNLENCIDSLTRSAKKASASVKIVVVTNNAKDQIDSNFSKKIDLLLHWRQEFNFAAMNNKAISKSIKKYRAEWLFLVNDDVWVSSDFFCEFEKKLSKDKQPDLANPIVYRGESTEVDSFGVEYFKSGYVKNAVNHSVYARLLTASALLVRKGFIRKMLDAYGYFFNPILGSYYEDVEMTIRALALGGTVMRYKELEAYHLGSFSTGRRSEYVLFQSYKNSFWVVVLTWPRNIILKNILSIFIVQMWFLFYATLKYGPGFYFEVIKKTSDNLQHLLVLRKNTILRYDNKFDMGKVYSKYIFRTRNGVAL
jgi:GT2 family glycosyltransferase